MQLFGNGITSLDTMLGMLGIQVHKGSVPEWMKIAETVGKAEHKVADETQYNNLLLEIKMTKDDIKRRNSITTTQEQGAIAVTPLIIDTVTTPPDAATTTTLPDTATTHHMLTPPIINIITTLPDATTTTTLPDAATTHHMSTLLDALPSVSIATKGDTLYLTNTIAKTTGETPPTDATELLTATGTGNMETILRGQNINGTNSHCTTGTAVLHQTSPPPVDFWTLPPF